MLIPVAVRSKAWVCGRLLDGIVGSNPAGGMVVCLLLSVVCSQVEIFESGRSLVQRSLTECGVSECDHEAPVIRRPWPSRGCCAIGNKYVILKHTFSHYFTVMFVSSSYEKG
jgi:hypothetical protein